MTKMSLLNYNVLRLNRQRHSEILSLVIAFFPLKGRGERLKTGIEKRGKENNSQKYRDMPKS